jgi:hypothetical protein
LPGDVLKSIVDINICLKKVSVNSFLKVVVNFSAAQVENLLREKGLPSLFWNKNFLGFWAKDKTSCLWSSSGSSYSIDLYRFEVLKSVILR